METLNATILEVIADASLFPPNEGYRFTPTDREPDKLHINPRDPIYDGVVCDILHPADGRIIAKKSPDAHEKVSYCCGVSFEAWFYAMQRYHHQHPNDEIKNPLTELSSDQLRDVVNTWFCPTMGHDGVVSALLSPPSPRLSSDDTATWALGERVASLEDAQPGDLIQYWRSVDLARPSGHSAVFLHYDPSTNALTYWSSQRKTNGIGENVEIIDPAVWELHIVRPLVAFHLCKR